MKIEFSLKEKKATFDADVEGLIQKSMETKATDTNRKTKYQIKQAEKRKNAELKQKQLMQGIFLLLGLAVLFAIIGIVGSIFGI